MTRKIRKNRKKEEDKKAENDNSSRKEKDEGEIRAFSLQSAIVIMASSLLGSLAVPYILSLWGISWQLGTVLGNTFFTSFGFTWARFFIDSRKGYTKEFWRQYAIFGAIFGAISYFWIFRKSFI